MRLLKQSTAANVLVFMTDSADHVSGKTGLTLTITASKDGGAFASVSPTVTERGNGWYSLALTTAHTDTAGDMGFHVTGTGADPTDFVCYVVPRHLADLAFPATSGRSLAVEADGMVYADVREWLGGAPLALASQRVQALMAAVTAGLIDSTALADDAITAAKIAAGAITASEAPALANLDVAVSSRGTADPGDAMTLAAAYDAAKTASQAGDAMALTAAAVDAVLDEIVEGGLSLRQIMRLQIAALFGESSGGGTATIIFRDLADTKARITATVDANGNRTAVTIDGS
jgi:hypothetical protein